MHLESIPNDPYRGLNLSGFCVQVWKGNNQRPSTYTREFLDVPWRSSLGQRCSRCNHFRSPPEVFQACRANRIDLTTGVCTPASLVRRRGGSSSCRRVVPADEPSPRLSRTKGRWFRTSSPTESGRRRRTSRRARSQIEFERRCVGMKLVSQILFPNSWRKEKEQRRKRRWAVQEALQRESTHIVPIRRK